MNAGLSPISLFAVLWRPVPTLRRVAEERRAFPGFIMVALYAVLALVASIAFVLTGVTRRQLEQGLPPDGLDAVVRATEIGGPISAAVTPFLFWVSVSLLMQLTTRFFNGTGPLSSVLGVVGVAQAPLLVAAVLVSLLTGLQLLIGAGTAAGVALGYLVSLIGPASLLWYAVLVVIGASQARDIGYGESAGSCAISCVGLGILIIVVAVLAGVGILAAVNAAAP